MSTLRFALVAAGLFALAFVGISWGSKGFPVMAMRAQPAQPDARVPTSEESAAKGARKDGGNSKTAHGDSEAKREELRLATLQAANAFALSPCDATMKKNLVQALSAYAKAWTEVAGCRFGICGVDLSRSGTAAKFATPTDLRVREAVQAAFEKGGISREDFPSSLQLWVMMMAADPGDPVSACATGRRTSWR